MKNRFRAVSVVAGSLSCSLGWGLLAAPAHADIAGFGDFSGFTITQADSAAAPAIFPGQDMIQLTNQGGGEHRSICFNTRQTITSFSASFIYRAVGSPSNTIGACLVFQNSPAGAAAVGVIVSPPLGWLLIWCALGMFIHANLLYFHMRQQAQELADAAIDSGQLAERVRRLRGEGVRELTGAQHEWNKQAVRTQGR